MATLSLRNIKKVYGNKVTAVDNFNLEIADKEYYEYADKLLLHVRELVELENAVNFKGNCRISIVLTEDELENFCKNNSGELKTLYLGHDVLLSKEQKDFLLRTYPSLDTTEVFSIALFNAVEKLSKKGILNFFLPESILNVGTHKNIRKFLLQSKRDIEIIPFGMAFKGVQSECILLKLSAMTDDDVKIVVKKDTDVILDKKNIIAPDYLISYNVSDFDNEIINKIYSAKSTKLSANTKFALGIVTGNNKKYVHETKIADDEPIFRGKDILPYKLKDPETFIRFTPEVFQQVAPTEMYRSKKILYKFISDKIVCTLDDNSLVLNSANIIISNDYPMEILICLFNSPIYSFIYQKKFKSKKVLKQHFQDFPLPVLDKKTKECFLIMYDNILHGKIEQFEIDKKICEYFKISDKQYNHIKECVYGIA